MGQRSPKLAPTAIKYFSLGARFRFLVIEAASCRVSNYILTKFVINIQLCLTIIFRSDFSFSNPYFRSYVETHEAGFLPNKI